MIQFQINVMYTAERERERERASKCLITLNEWTQSTEIRLGTLTNQVTREKNYSCDSQKHFPGPCRIKEPISIWLQLSQVVTIFSALIKQLLIDAFIAIISY